MSEKENVTTEMVSPTNYDEHVDAPRPEGWMYRGRRIGKLEIPWYASPKIQLGMVAFVCFLCPGMFNALGGLGGGGKTDHTLADNMVSCAVWLKYWNCKLITSDCRTPPCIVLSPSSVSLVELSSTDWVVR